ncbi:MAG: hypothetical protein AMXMBFR59_27510 [Rhodanobacteraceae bacterium]
MSVYRLMSSTTLPPKFAIACAAAMGFAGVSLFFGQNHVAPVTTPQPLAVDAVILPTIVVVPTAADRAAAAALDIAAVRTSDKRLDEV